MENKNKTVPTFQYFFRIDVLLLQFLGLRSFNNFFSGDKLNTRWWDGYRFYISVPLVFFVTLVQLHTIFVIKPDLDFTIEVISSLCSVALSTLKGTRWWICRDQLYDIMKQLSINWETARARNYLTLENLKIAEKARSKRSTYIISIIIIFSTFSAQPYMNYIRYQFFGTTNDSFDFNVTLGNSAVYPFTIKTFQAYSIFIFYQQIVGFYVCVYWACSDSLFIQLMSHIEIQFKILARRLEDIVKDDDDDFNHDNYIQQELRNIAQQHQKLYLYCQSSEHIYRPIILLTVLSNGISLCCCLFILENQLSEFDFDVVSQFGVQLVCISIQTILYCSFAENVTQSTEQLARAAQSSKWIEWNQKNKKTLLIIMMRAAKEYQFSAYDLVVLSLKQITTIFNGAASYFMFLKNTE